jgi:alkylation response protein AidB-like acyl-CoA dehydrogenase
MPMTAVLQPPVADQRIAAATALSEDLASRAAQHDRDGSFPFESFRRLRDVGLLNLTVPTEYGGDGLGLSTVRRVVEQVARGDASTALVLTMHYLMHAGAARERRWPEAVYRQVCESSVRDVALINAFRVEPELGTPARGGLPATIAARSADSWRISGHKIYSTGSPMLSWMLVWARTDDVEPLVGMFLVPADASGIRIVETWDHLGMRATGSHDVILENVAVPSLHAVDLRRPSEWVERSPLATAWNCVLVSSVYQGAALAARDWLVRYLHERVPSNLGASLATLPRFQATVGQIEALLHTSDRLLAAVAADADETADALSTADLTPHAAASATPNLAALSAASVAPNLAQSAPLAKLTVTGNAIRAVELGLELTGNPGLSRRNPLERHYRDVLCSRVHTPQDDSILAMAGKAALAAAPETVRTGWTG